MKKHLLLILCALFISVSLSAQSSSSQHLKFMGIPINGSITNFQNKLIAKGFKYDQSGSKALDSPTRIFKGQFAGETAELYVYYDRDQKFVYRVKAVIRRNSEEQILPIMRMFRNQLIEKYNASAEEGVYEGNESYYIPVENGWIDLFYSQTLYDIGYSLHLDYWDDSNARKHEKNNMNDL